MKHVIALMVFTAFTSAQAIEIGCWDGTFGYNTMGFVEKDARFELSVRGGNLGPLLFETSHEVVSVRLWGSNQSIHVPFAKNECRENAETKEIRCEKARAHFGEPNFFVNRDVANLDAWVEIITPLEAEKISVTIQPEKEITVEFIGANVEQNSTQKITFNLMHCYSQSSVKFPEELEKFLDR